MATNVVETNDMHMEQMISAIILFPTLQEAQAHLAEQGLTISTAKLEVWAKGGGRYSVRERIAQRRREMAPKLEAELTGQQLSDAMRTQYAVSIAIERAREMLVNGECPDPARTARDLMQVESQMLEKMLSLEGRPTKVIETRTPEQIIRRLRELGAADFIDGTAEEDE
jgi:hypothetical protein